MQNREEASIKHMQSRRTDVRREKKCFGFKPGFAVFSLLFLAATILYWNGASFGLSVYVNGDKLATVERNGIRRSQ